MTDEQLLQELQNKNLLSPETAARLRREAIIANLPVQAVLFQQSVLPDEKVAAVKAALLKVPYKKIDFASFDDTLLKVMPEETVRTYAVAPLSRKDNVFVAGMVNPDDSKAQEALRFISHRERLNLGVFLISYGDWQQVLRKYSPYKSEVEAAVRSLDLKAGEGGRRVVQLEEGINRAEDAPVIRIVADTLREAVQAGASDIHIEPQENRVRIRFRTDGDLHEVASLPLELVQAVVSRVKILSNLKIDETRVPQDGRFRSRILDREIDFRVATFPTPLGEKVAIRILDPQTGLKSFEKLGLAGRNLETAQTALSDPFGMVLVTGPTGSGKTTTLYAMLQLLNKEDINIVSLEDPVEYFVTGVNQSQVRPEIGYDFASGLRQILRQDPDVIMVGEIRDTETAGLAINAALTGHIVLSTLHTNNAAGVAPRLIDMKVESFLLPSALNLMLAQRLVSKLCVACRQAETPPVAVQSVIDKALATVPAAAKDMYAPPYQVYHAPGCDVCRGKGVSGRIAIFEAIKMSPGLAEVINSNPTSQKIMTQAKKDGMLTMRQDGVLKALAGLVSIEEIIKETEEV